MKKNGVLIFFYLISIFSIEAQNSTWDIVKQMGRGINLGNTLSAPTEGNWAPIFMNSILLM